MNRGKASRHLPPSHWRPSLHRVKNKEKDKEFSKKKEIVLYVIIPSAVAALLSQQPGLEPSALLLFRRGRRGNRAWR